MKTYSFYHTIFFVAYSHNIYVSPSYAEMTFAPVSLTMHRPLASVTFNMSLNPTTKHLSSLSDTNILDVWPRCVKHLTKGTEIYAISEFEMHGDMIFS